MDNIYVVGTNFSYMESTSDIFLVKYDCNGNYLWNRTWGGINDEFVSEIVVDSLDNVYILGATESFGKGEYDLFLLKYNNSGVLQWWRTWGGNLNDYGEDIIVDSSDTLYICAYSVISEYPNYKCESILLKYDTSGNLLLNKRSNRCGYFSLANDPLDQIYIAGWDEIFQGGMNDMCVAKFNNLEFIKWELFWGTAAEERCYSIILDQNDNIYLAGGSNSNAILLKNPENKTGIFLDTNKKIDDSFVISFGFYFILFMIIGLIYIISVRILKKDIN